MPSLLQLTNRVLSELGRQRVDALDNRPDASFIAAKILELYPEVLLETTWNFAVIYREDATPLATNYSPDYIYTYQLPADFGRFFKWAATGDQWPSYEFADGLLLAQTLPVQYYYISNNPSFELLTPLFARTLVLYTASKCSTVLTNNVQLTAILDKEYQRILAKAIMQNDMERSVETTPYNDYDRITFV